METSPAQIQKYLRDIEYPVTKDELVDHAEELGAPEEVLDMLREISEKDYNSPADLMKELGAATRE